MIKKYLKLKEEATEASRGQGYPAADSAGSDDRCAVCIDDL
jgi:hypothetical protein